MDEKKNDYPLIPMNEITDEAKKIAVVWMDCDDKNWIENKHKLALDIMNYAKKYANQNLTQIDWDKIKLKFWQTNFDFRFDQNGWQAEVFSWFKNEITDIIKKNINNEIK